MNIRADRFFHELNRLFPNAEFLIAFSGGLDSSVLLNLCATGAGVDSRSRLRAVHANHRLNPHSDQWAGFCKSICAGLGIDFRAVTLDVSMKPGSSLEETARIARYAALLSLMTENTVLLTAQHLDDQAETILLQLLRGGGLRGLSGMPESIGFGPGVLHRPLLGFPRASLHSYAVGHGLEWIDDPSNWDIGHARNYLRHAVIPRIREYWPGMAKTLARAGKHCAEAQKIIDAEVEARFCTVVDVEQNRLRVSRLTEFDTTHQRLILRYWIRRSGFRSPSRVILQRILDEAITAAPDRLPIIRWSEVEVRRYRDALYLLRAPAPFDRHREIPWSLTNPLPIPELGGSLECRCRSRNSGVPANEVCVRFRKGGETCRVPGRKGSRSLKKVLQELKVPPWERDRIPLIYAAGELAAIGDRLICEPFARTGIEIHWISQ